MLQLRRKRRLSHRKYAPFVVKFSPVARKYASTKNKKKGTTSISCSRVKCKSHRSIEIIDIHLDTHLSSDNFSYLAILYRDLNTYDRKDYMTEKEKMNNDSG